MAFLSLNPGDEFMRGMIEKALRFTPPLPPKRIEPLMDMEAMLERVERRRVPLIHAPDKPVEQMLAEEMDLFSVPF